MRPAYLIATILLILAGLRSIAMDFLGTDMFYGVGTLAGLALVFTGGLNLLHLTYGPGAPAARPWAIGASLSLLAVSLGQSGPPKGVIEWATDLLLLLTAILAAPRGRAHR
jgi:hypothetical protein